MWAVRLPLDEVAALGPLRTIVGIDAGHADGALWLRGRELSDNLRLELSKLPLAERYHVAEGALLRPAGKLVPSGSLPPIDWRPIAQFLEPRLPTAALAGRRLDRCALGLTRANVERTTNVLIVSLSDLVAFVATAPNVRLHGCRFAVDAAGRAVIHGSPLPTLPGERCAEEHGVALPAGFGFSPPLPLSIAAEALRLNPGDLALFRDDGSYDRIAGEQFAKLTRSAARMTHERQVTSRI